MSDIGLSFSMDDSLRLCLGPLVLAAELCITGVTLHNIVLTYSSGACMRRRIAAEIEHFDEKAAHPAAGSGLW